jgi:hypothetical protein
LLVDIDGVVSLFAFAGASSASSGAAALGPLSGGPAAAPGGIEGSLHTIDGIPHFLSSTAAGHLLGLARAFELVWASGWEERANEHLPRLLGLPASLPFIPFSERATLAERTPQAHWKLAAISAYVGEHPLAWVDDAFNPACHEWALARGAPTLLVSTAPERGLTSQEAETLHRWARELAVSR